MCAGRTADMSKKPRTVADVFGRRTFFDLSGPYRSAGVNGERFVLLFIDCYTHWRTIVLMQRKSEAVEAIIKYHRTVIIPALRDQKDTTVLFRTDKDAVWGDREVKELKPYCDAQGIKAEFAATASPWHIGLCERQWSTVGNIVRKLLIHGKLPATFWIYAYPEGIRVMNWTLTVRDTGLSSYDLKEGKPPRREVSNQRAFGSIVYKVRVDRAE